jgi:pseudoazurin
LRWLKLRPAEEDIDIPNSGSSGNPFQKGRDMKKLAILTVVASLAVAGIARAAEVEVKLLNKGSDGRTMAFEPAFVKIATGDVVKFLSTDKGHNAEAIKGMLPDGAKRLVGKNGEDIAVKFEREGVYGVKCLPHYGICMVVMVGAASANVDQGKAVPHVGKTKQGAGKMASR